MEIEKLIGHTPMIKINYEYQHQIKSIYVKLEYYNLTGSIKDRMAIYIIKQAKEKGLLKENMPIIEATSGNTGISLAAMGAYLKHPVYIFMPDWVSNERKAIMEMYGAQVILISKEQGGFQECIKQADLLAKKINGFRPNQFINNDNVIAHQISTAKEIKSKLPKVDAFISGIGTGGTLIGIAKYLKPQGTKIYALEPDKLPLLTKGLNIGSHLIEGIGDDFIPDIVDQNLIDDVISINDLDAINMSRKLASELGLGVGISSGANFLGAVIINSQNTNNTVTIFVDDNKKYISTLLKDRVATDPNFISSKIKLINFEVL